MSRLPILICGVLAGAVSSLVFAGPARGDEDGDLRLARTLITAAEKRSDLQEMVSRYGRRADVALAILHDEELRLNVDTEIRNMNTVIAGFPPRKWWLADHKAYHEVKLARDRQLNAIDRELGDLRLEERRMYEEEMAKARASGKALVPLHREALLNEIQRLDRESGAAVIALKEGLESAAREGRTTPRQVLDRVVGRLASLDAPTSVEREFVPRFIKYAGNRWLEGQKKPAPPKTKKPVSRPRKKNTA